ncbi:MAG: hypothetical protein V1723_00475 [Candidatus Uhrbacteria bacterium]
MTDEEEEKNWLQADHGDPWGQEKSSARFLIIAIVILAVIAALGVGLVLYFK